MYYVLQTIAEPTDATAYTTLWKTYTGLNDARTEAGRMVVSGEAVRVVVLELVAIYEPAEPAAVVTNI
jgi:hypothetical protein